MKNRGCYNCRWSRSCYCNSLVCRHESNCYTEITYSAMFGEQKEVKGYEAIDKLNENCKCSRFEEKNFLRRNLLKLKEAFLWEN